MFLSLFLVAFVSATLWPLASEVVLLTFLHQNPDALLTLLTIAIAGNSLGSILMFELAASFETIMAQRYRDKMQRLQVWQARLHRYGTPVLALAWLPVVGDLLPIFAGLLRLNRGWAYFWLCFGKACRYSLLVAISVGWLATHNN